LSTSTVPTSPPGWIAPSPMCSRGKECADTNTRSPVTSLPCQG
jgi:hypothetical protein